MSSHENLVRRLSVALFAEGYGLAGMGKGQVTLKKDAVLVLLLSHEEFDRWPHLKLGQIGAAQVVLLGGGEEALAQLKSAKPRFTGGRVNLHHLSDTDELWTSGKQTGPVAQALLNRHSLPQVTDQAFGEILRPQLESLKAEVIEQFSFQRSMAGRKTLVTYGLLAVSAVFFVLEMLWGGPDSVPTLVGMGALLRERALGTEWWRMLSYAFLHGSIMHVAFNGYVLFLLGRGMERIVGSERFLIIYVLSALGGGLASSLALQEGHAVGASGAIWGLLAAHGVLAFRPAGLLPESALPGQKKAALTNLGLNVMISFHPQVDWAAHAGGGLVGGLLVASGLVTIGLPRLAELADGQPVVDRKPVWLQAVAASLGILLLGSAAHAQMVGRPWTLKDNPVFVRRTIGESQLSLEVPEHLAPAPTSASRPDVDTAVYGNWLEDVAIFDTLGIVIEPPIPPSRMQAEFQALQGSLHVGLPESAKELGTTAVEADQFLVVRKYRLENGLQLERAAIMTAKFICRVDLIVWPEFYTGVWVGAAQRSVQTCSLPSAPR